QIVERCEPGPRVHGEIWLRRHEHVLIVYWEAWESPLHEDGTPSWNPGYTDAFGTVSRTLGATRWQAVAVVPTETLPEAVRDLARAFAELPDRDLLLQIALRAVDQEISHHLVRGRFVKLAHRWRERKQSLWE